MPETLSSEQVDVRLSRSHFVRSDVVYVVYQCERLSAVGQSVHRLPFLKIFVGRIAIEMSQVLLNLPSVSKKTTAVEVVQVRACAEALRQ